jgi:hypothetical protein
VENSVPGGDSKQAGVKTTGRTVVQVEKMTKGCLRGIHQDIREWVTIIVIVRITIPRQFAVCHVGQEILSWG